MNWQNPVPSNFKAIQDSGKHTINYYVQAVGYFATGVYKTKGGTTYYVSTVIGPIS